MSISFTANVLFRETEELIELATRAIYTLENHKQPLAAEAHEEVLQDLVDIQSKLKLLKEGL